MDDALNKPTPVDVRAGGLGGPGGLSHGAPSLIHAFLAQAARTPDAVATRHFDRDGQIVDTTWAELRRTCLHLARGLVAHGLPPGGRVALLVRTRVEWAWLDIAIQWAGGISVPIFPNELAENCAEILADSGARLAVAENPWQLKKLLEADDAIPETFSLVLVDEVMTLRSGAVMTPSEMGVHARRYTTLAALVERGSRAGAPGVAGLGDISAQIAQVAGPDGVVGDGCVTINYTPGTEGSRKGVMLTHDSFVFTAGALAARLGVGPEDTQLLYLPLAQSFARVSLWTGILAGATTAFARSYRTVHDDCEQLNPTFLCGVPRLYEKSLEIIHAEMRDTGGVMAVMAGWAFASGGKAPESRPEGWIPRLKQEATRRVIRGRLAKAFGGRLRFAISGGAPLGKGLSAFYRDHGVTLLEGYGMVETTAATHLDPPADYVPGTVGRPLDGVAFKLLDDGELCVRGANVTCGYWGNPEETRRVLDGDGWFHTGDLGKVDPDGRLRITGRKRDIIVTANGKTIAPEPIARTIREDALVSQVLIHGDRRTFLTALITLKPEPLQRFAAAGNLGGDYETLSRSPAVYAHIQAIIDRVNAGLPPHENIKKFAILHSEMSEESGELTPMRGLRRRVAAERHRALLDSFYTDTF